jgi:hypothetical protein
MPTWQQMSDKKRRWAIYRKVLHLQGQAHDRAIWAGLIEQYGADCSLSWVCRRLKDFERRGHLQCTFERGADNVVQRYWHPKGKRKGCGQQY